MGKAEELKEAILELGPEAAEGIIGEPVSEEELPARLEESLRKMPDNLIDMMYANLQEEKERV